MARVRGRIALLFVALAACSPAAQDDAATAAGTAGDGDTAKEEAASARATGSSVATIPAEPVRDAAAVAAIVADDVATHPASAAEPAPSIPPSFHCAGDAPPWTLDLAAAGAALTIDDASTMLPGELKRTAGGAWTWLGATDDAPDRSVALLLVPGQCFPAEGAPAQPYLAELSLADGRRTTGCCAPVAGD
jgi:hypothetical protein